MFLNHARASTGRRHATPPGRRGRPGPPRPACRRGPGAGRPRRRPGVDGTGPRAARGARRRRDVLLYRRRGGSGGLQIDQIDRLREAELALASSASTSHAARDLANQAMALLGAPSATVIIEGIGDTVRVTAGSADLRLRPRQPHAPARRRRRALWLDRGQRPSRRPRLHTPAGAHARRPGAARVVNPASPVAVHRGPDRAPHTRRRRRVLLRRHLLRRRRPRRALVEPGHGRDHRDRRTGRDRPRRVVGLPRRR